jgi:acyl-CoA synthetase (AMP-forming)/AMP-acid ligase II/acyl carrier protein
MTSAGTIPSIFRRQAELLPAATAITAPGRLPLDYSGLWRQIEDHVRTLSGLALIGKPIAVVMGNGPEMAVTFLATSSIAAFAPLNPGYREREFDFYLSDLQAAAVIVESGVESPVRDVARKREIPLIELSPDLDQPAGVFRLDGSGSGVGDSLPFARPDDVALILHTSGTTSRPKMVPLTHANLCASARNISAVLQLRRDDRCLNVMPLFHIHGLMAGLLASLTEGASVACTPGFIATRFFEWLDQMKPTWYTAVPTMHQAILARVSENRQVVSRSRLRLIRSSSSALPPQVMHGLEGAFGAPVIESYGMTEASHQMTSNPLPPRPRKPKSVGVAAGPEVRILGEDGQFAGPAESGEVVIRGENVLARYLENPEATKRAFVHGWFRTGDEGYLDSDGYLFLTGRIKEMINRGGEKIAPREIDDVLLDHPAVAQAVAFGIPDTRLGEDVAAAVVLRPGVSVGEHELRAHVAGKLAEFKVPRRILILDEIPKGATGKIQRIGMAERLGLALQLVSEPDLKAESIAPRTPVEVRLARIWCDVLGLERIGVRDRFLSAGGDSMLATMLIARVRDEMKVEISMLDFFDASTIEEQAKLIGRALDAGSPQADASASGK